MGALQHDAGAVRGLLEPLVGKAPEQEGSQRKEATPKSGCSTSIDDAGTDTDKPTFRFHSGRSDAVTLTFEAATDIYETVQKWHNEKHREMMRAHFKGPSDGQVSEEAAPPQTASTAFSVTPTLDAAEAAMSVADSVEPSSPAKEAVRPAPRGAASHHIEEAQLR